MRSGRPYLQQATANTAEEIAHDDDDAQCFSAMIAIDDNISTTLCQAQKSPDVAHLQAGVDAELNALTSKAM